MPQKFHSPPGFVDDLTDDNKKKWSEKVSEDFMLTEHVSPTLTPQFYDATKVDDEQDVSTAVITWIAFPKNVKLQYPNDEKRWQVADGDRDAQDEYLEWSVVRNSDDKIIKIVFSNEGPEYFEFLAENQPDTLLSLYRSLNPGADIKEEDLYAPDENGNLVYDERNKWNISSTTGTIMHLIQRNNTLGAEIDLGGRATIVRKRPDGTVITDEQELINCTRYGDPKRNSDPHIGISINNLVRLHPLRLTVNDPIGLYIHSVNWGMVDPPAGHEEDNPSDFWTWIRGKNGHYMRAEFEVPEEKGYVVGDLLVNGQPLKYAAQLTDYILISITGRVSAWDRIVDPVLCPGSQASNTSSAAQDAVMYATLPVAGVATKGSKRFRSRA